MTYCGSLIVMPFWLETERQRIGGEQVLFAKGNFRSKSIYHKYYLKRLVQNYLII